MQEKCAKARALLIIYFIWHKWGKGFHNMLDMHAIMKMYMFTIWNTDIVPNSCYTACTFIGMSIRKNPWKFITGWKGSLHVHSYIQINTSIMFSWSFEIYWYFHCSSAEYVLLWIQMVQDLIKSKSFMYSTLTANW